MKTNSFFKQKKSIYLLFGILSLIINSCGSYKNTSYVDNDGVYGSTPSRTPDNRSSNTNSDNTKYKDYFGSLRDKEEPNPFFTDVESYNSNATENTTTDNQNQGYENSYSGWGNNPGTVNVTVYDSNGGWNNYWNWNLGWGWNSWYGPSYYGWNWNPWYNPYNNWGWNMYYGNSYYDYGYNGYYNHNYAYNSGRRGSTYRNSNSNYNYQYNNGQRNSNLFNGTRRNTNPPRNNVKTDISGTRNQEYNTPRNPVRTQTTNPYTNYPNYNNTPRTNYNSTPRTAPNNSTRSYNTNTYSPPRTSNSTNNSGGGNSTGGYSGGGRSSGGRR